MAFESQTFNTGSRKTQRSRNGCQQCRHRRQKCDETHPRCHACIERDLTCEWPQHEQSRKHVVRRRPRYNKDFAVPGQISPLVTIFTLPSSSTIQTILSHFYSNGPLWVTFGGQGRASTFLNLIMPIANRNPLVLNCILALAAGDLSKYEPASSDMSALSQSFYGQAVLGIQSKLSGELDAVQGGDSSDDALLAIILLCVHEAVNFTDIDRLLPHINAAATLSHRRSFADAEQSQLRGLLFEIFLYHVALSSFSHGRYLQLDLAIQVMESPFLSDTYHQGILLGQCRDIFILILRIAKLASSSTSPLVDTNTKNELVSIEQRLSVTENFIPPGGNAEATDERTIMQLYRIACLIHVKRTLHAELPVRSEQLQQLVSEFITNLNLLPEDSSANGILCWPLVVAGTASVIGTHRRLIGSRLRKNHKTWRTDILSKSSDLLSKMWKRDREGVDMPFDGPIGNIIRFAPRQQHIEYSVVML